MVYNDSWTAGLTKKQQNCVLDYVINECRLFPGIGGFKNKQAARKFLDSEKGRRAVRLYCEFAFDTNKDTVKLRLVKINLVRALFNPADIIDIDGKLLIENSGDLRKLGELAYAIDGIETKIEGYHTAEDGKLIPIKTVKIKLCNRDKAMEFLTKVFQIFQDDNIEDFTGEKSVYEMSDEERDNEINRLLEKLQKSRKMLPEKGGEKDE